MPEIGHMKNVKKKKISETTKWSPTGFAVVVGP